MILTKLFTLEKRKLIYLSFITALLAPLHYTANASINKNDLGGTPCKKYGFQTKDSSGLVECRKVAGNKQIYIRIRNKFDQINNPTSPEPLTTCQLPDMRETKLWPRPGIAYPPIPFQGFQSTGTFKVVVVGIDFPDAIGTGLPSQYWNSDLKYVTDWLKWYTNDKIKYNFVTYDKWLRSTRNAAAFENQNEASKAAGANTLSLGGVSDKDKTSEFIKLFENEIDLSGTTAIWIYHPENIIGKLTGQWYDRDVHYQSQKFGLITPSLFAIGGDTWASKRIRWGYFIHEMMHSHGVFGHSPKIPWRIGMMSTGDSWSSALLSWDSLATGFTNQEDIFCIDKNNLTSYRLKLVPLEREQKGNRVAMIKLNDHQLLMVESHRKDKWSFGLEQGFTGAMVTLIDTTKNTTWDNSEGFKNPSSVGIALEVPFAKHGFHKQIGKSIPNATRDYQQYGIINGIGISGDTEKWSLNYFMYQGESIQYDGVKIALDKTGDNDEFIISRY